MELDGEARKEVEDLFFCWYWKEVFYYPCVYVHSLINPEKAHWCIPARQTVLVVSRALLGDWWSLWSLRNRYSLWGSLSKHSSLPSEIEWECHLGGKGWVFNRHCIIFKDNWVWKENGGGDIFRMKTISSTWKEEASFTKLVLTRWNMNQQCKFHPVDPTGLFHSVN